MRDGWTPTDVPRHPLEERVVRPTAAEPHHDAAATHHHRGRERRRVGGNLEGINILLYVLTAEAAATVLGTWRGSGSDLYAGSRHQGFATSNPNPVGTLSLPQLAPSFIRFGSREAA